MESARPAIAVWSSQISLENRTEEGFRHTHVENVFVLILLGRSHSLGEIEGRVHSSAGSVFFL